MTIVQSATVNASGTVSRSLHAARVQQHAANVLQDCRVQRLLRSEGVQYRDMPEETHFQCRAIQYPTGKILGAEGPVYRIIGRYVNRNGVDCVYGVATNGDRASCNVEYAAFVTAS